MADAVLYNELKASIDAFNKIIETINANLEAAMQQNHIHHTLSEECERIALTGPDNYFEKVYSHLSRTSS